MGYSDNPNDSDLTIVTDILQYSIFATQYYAGQNKGILTGKYIAIKSTKILFAIPAS
jgi:hypothetical protein